MIWHLGTSLPGTDTVLCPLACSYYLKCYGRFFGVYCNPSAESQLIKVLAITFARLKAWVQTCLVDDTEDLVLLEQYLEIRYYKEAQSVYRRKAEI